MTVFYNYICRVCISDETYFDFLFSFCLYSSTKIICTRYIDVAVSLMRHDIPEKCSVFLKPFFHFEWKLFFFIIIIISCFASIQLKRVFFISFCVSNNFSPQFHQWWWFRYVKKKQISIFFLSLSIVECVWICNVFVEKPLNLIEWNNICTHISFRFHFITVYWLCFQFQKETVFWGHIIYGLLLRSSAITSKKYTLLNKNSESLIIIEAHLLSEHTNIHTMEIHSQFLYCTELGKPNISRNPYSGEHR